MIQYFQDQGTEDIFNGRITGAALRTCPRTLWKIAVRKLDQLDSIMSLRELSELVLDKTDQTNTGFPILERYEVCFTWGEAGPELAAIVEKD